ncbi:MAG TPA: hypothetical protein VLI68_00470 [Hanamia sp.]|nr:hypothetical protein [Hanamia sp.]
MISKHYYSFYCFYKIILQRRNKYADFLTSRAFTGSFPMFFTRVKDGIENTLVVVA